MVVGSRARTRKQFRVSTNAENNVAKNQMFIECIGPSVYGTVTDDFTPIDVPESFHRYPKLDHDGSQLSVQQFIEKYAI